MTYIGITLLLITTLSLLIIFIFNKYLKIVLRSYWFYSIFSILFLVYFILLRYADNVETLINSKMKLIQFFDPYSYSFIYSKVLLLDLCPMISILLPLSLIFDKTRNIAKVLSLFGIIGGFITIYGNMILIKQINIPLWEFILIGEQPNALMFSSHFLILILSIVVILNSTCYTKWSFSGVIVFFVAFISYVLIISSILDIQCNTTGLQPGDWYDPNDNWFWYSQYGNLYKLIPLSYEFCIVFWYTIAGIIISTIMVSKNWLNNDFRNASTPWYRKLKLIREPLYKIDVNINSFFLNIENILKFSKKSQKLLS